MGNHDSVAPRRAAGQARASATPQPQVSVLRSGLVEVLVVMTVIGLLSAIVVAGVVAMKERVTRFACDADVSTVALAADAYYTKHFAYPVNSDALQFDGYLRPSAQNDYAVRYLLNSDGRGFRVTGQTTSGQPCKTAASG